MRKIIWLSFGLVVSLWWLMSRPGTPVSASGLLALTETPTPSPTLPPTDTPVPQPTSIATSTALPSPTATTLPASTPQATPVQHDPLITKRVDLAQAVVGDEVLFTITVLNPSDADIPNVSVTDPLPALLDFLGGATTAGTLSYDSATHTVLVDIGTLTPHQEVTITIRARVNQLGQPPDVITNLAYAGDNPSNPVDVPLVPAGLPQAGFGPGPRERGLMWGVVGLGLTAGLGLWQWMRRRL